MLLSCGPACDNFSASPSYKPFYLSHRPPCPGQVPLNQLLKPLVEVESSDPSHWGSHPLVRLGVGAALAGVLYVLYAHAPDKGGLLAAGMAAAPLLRDFDVASWLLADQHRSISRTRRSSCFPI